VTVVPTGQVALKVCNDSSFGTVGIVTTICIVMEKGDSRQSAYTVSANGPPSAALMTVTVQAFVWSTWQFTSTDPEPALWSALLLILQMPDKPDRYTLELRCLRSKPVASP
jgi:hypothetical protein